MKKYPNIILITADSLRADYCSFLGGKKHLTPFLDKIASEGLVFENAYSNGPMTAISFPAIMTGTWPIFKRSTKVGPRITISEVLSKIGYITLGYVSSNDYAMSFSGDKSRFLLLNNVGPAWYKSRENRLTLDLIRYFLRGLKKDKEKMSKFIDSLTIFLYDVINLPFDFFRSYIVTALAKILKGAPPQSLSAVLDRSVTELTIRTVRELKKSKCKRPIFIWLHYMSTHMPYGFSFDDEWKSCIKNLQEKVLVSKILKHQAANNKEIEALRRCYELGVKEFDKNVNTLFGEIEDILDNTILIFTSDHGEEFFEYGKYGHFPVHLYDVNLRIPLVIWGLPEKGRENVIVSSVDIFPTILSLVNLNNKRIFEQFLGILDGRPLISNDDMKRVVISEGIDGGRMFIDVLLGKRSKIVVPGVKVAVRATNEEGHCIIENVVGKPDIKVVECTNEDLVEVCKKRLMEILGKSERDRKLELLIGAIRAAYALR